MQANRRVINVRVSQNAHRALRVLAATMETTQEGAVEEAIFRTAETRYPGTDWRGIRRGACLAASVNTPDRTRQDTVHIPLPDSNGEIQVMVGTENGGYELCTMTHSGGSQWTVASSQDDAVVSTGETFHNERHGMYGIARELANRLAQ